MTPSLDRSSTDDRIIHAALELIAQDGLGAATMVRVAETAGIARQTLYNHYPDIDRIVTEAIRRHNQESIQLLEASLLVVDDPTDKLEQLVRHVIAIGAHAQHSHGIEHGLSADARATLNDYRDALDRCIREVLDEGQRFGVFRRDLTPEVDALLIRPMLYGLTERSAETPEMAASLATTGTRTILASVTAS